MSLLYRRTPIRIGSGFTREYWTVLESFARGQILLLIFPIVMGGVKTERVFPGLSVLRKNNKMEVLSPEK
jgi:hypothetical protein